MEGIGNKKDRSTLWFREIGSQDITLVGGKNASLGEMYNNLEHFGVKVPNGFAITTTAYDYFVSRAQIKDTLAKILGELQNDLSNLDDVSSKARRLILSAPLPNELREEICRCYSELEREFGPREKHSSRVDVAVRSSATAEDTKEASFAGQLETYLNIQGEDELLDAVRRCFASNFTSRVIDYREKLGYAHLDVSVSVGVQKMARSDKGSSGIAFTIDTNTGFEDVVVVNAGFGLGELVVGGQTNPDEYIVSKSMLKQGYRPIIGHTVPRKEREMVYFSQGATTAVVPVARHRQMQPALSRDEILQIAEWAVRIEEHYGCAVDIEWAKDGVSGHVFVVQARPATGVKEPSLEFDEYILEGEETRRVLEGVSVGDKIVTGRVRVIESFEQIGDFQEGEILVTRMTIPSWEPAMQKARAMITDEGGRKCHARLSQTKRGPPVLSARFARQISSATARR